MSKYTKFFLTILLICGLESNINAVKIDSVSTYFGYAGNAIKFGKEICSGVIEIYNMLQPKVDKDSESDVQMVPGMEKGITDQVKHVSKKLDSLKVDMKNIKDEVIDTILNEIPDQVNLKNKLDSIYWRINQIENLYENFINYVKAPKSFNLATLEDFALHATSHDLNELPNVLKNIHWMLVQKDVTVGDSIITILSRSTQVPMQMCKRQQSLQQMLYNLFNSVALADIKGYTMIQVSYTFLHSLNRGNYSAEIELAEDQFTARMTSTIEAVKKAMGPASRSVWKCDTEGYIEGVTYTKLNNVFSKYIDNEINLNKDATCSNTCTDYKKTKSYGCRENKKLCSTQNVCDGKLWDCQYKIGDKMWVCPAERNATRRYNYIEYGNSQRYGPKGKCPTSSFKISSYTKNLYACTYCTCICDDLNNEDSDRYVNLRDTIASIHENFVVTGLRFRKLNHILHIQIQQGKLLQGGNIDISTVHWKDVIDYKIREPYPGTENTQWLYVPREDVDYHVLEWQVKRGMNKNDKVLQRKAAINLDDLDFGDSEIGSNFVVTGLRFTVNEVWKSGHHLNLEVMLTEFNFDTGKLDTMNNVWYSTFKTKAGRYKLALKSNKAEVHLDDLDVPTNSGAPAVPTSQTNQYLYFTTSSMKTDVGQSTIPFIDLQSVETYPPVPLSGIGIFHKGSPGSGGFLSLKLFTYNYAPKLKVEQMDNYIG